MPSHLRWIFLLAFFGCAALLAGLEHVTFIHDREYLYYLLHHLFALIAGASGAGILFELIARKEMVAEFRREFLDNKNMSKLFADEQRQKWVQNILEAQLPSDQTLSQAIYTDVVEPFMSEQKLRRRMNYSIDLLKRPPAGWSLKGLNTRPDEYARLVVDMDYEQHLPRRFAEVNISLIVGTVFTELQTAFDDDACIYRDYLALHGLDVQAVRDELEALCHHHPPARIPDINVELWIDDRQISSSKPPEYVKGQGLIKFWFDVPSKPNNDVRLKIKIDAPYQETSGHYVIVFGEPTASPRVTFRPGDFASPESVLLLHFIQGGHRPDVTPNAKGIDVTFPHPDGKQWILPRSGLLFLWRDTRSIDIAGARDVAVATQIRQPYARPKRRSAAGSSR
jgi:hypothetical protein